MTARSIDGMPDQDAEPQLQQQHNLLAPTSRQPTTDDEYKKNPQDPLKRAATMCVMQGLSRTPPVRCRLPRNQSH